MPEVHLHRTTRIHKCYRRMSPSHAKSSFLSVQPFGYAEARLSVAKTPHLLPRDVGYHTDLYHTNLAVTSKVQAHHISRTKPDLAPFL